jgi:hypothetical protein
MYNLFRCTNPNDNNTVENTDVQVVKDFRDAECVGTEIRVISVDERTVYRVTVNSTISFEFIVEQEAIDCMADHPGATQSTHQEEFEASDTLLEE